MLQAASSSQDFSYARLQCLRGPLVSLCVRETHLTRPIDVSRNARRKAVTTKISHQFACLAQEIMAYGRKVVPPPATPFEEFMATTSEKMIAARLELVEFLSPSARQRRS